MLVLSTEPALTGSAASGLADIQARLDDADDVLLAEQGPTWLGDAVELARRGGATELTLEVEPVLRRHEELATTVGLERHRELLQLRRALPLDEPWSLDVRSFRPETDADAWLAVNNRAFEWHSEQGGWTLDDLRAREGEPWFDPAGFLLHFAAGHEADRVLAGFCWTKIHAETDPPLGEIYVIGVDPAFHGRGLGRPLLLAGLDHLARQGLHTAMLYVEADNEPALALYRHLGFTTAARHVWWTVSTGEGPTGEGSIGEGSP